MSCTEERKEAIKQLSSQRQGLLTMIHQAEAFNASQRVGNGHTWSTYDYERNIKKIDDKINKLCGLSEEEEK